MDTEDLVIYQRSKCEVVKDFCAVTPDVDRAVFPKALVIEPIYLSDLS